MNVNLVDVFYPSQVAAAATRLDAQAEELRARVGVVRRASEACPWDGAGARAFRRRAEEATTQLARAAELLGQASVALRRHSDDVAAALAARSPR